MIEATVADKSQGQNVATDKNSKEGGLDISLDEKGQPIGSLFQEDKKCRIILGTGVSLATSSVEECLAQCLEDDGCQSVSYNTLDDESENCLLNTETKYDVGPFFICNEPTWSYFEKVRDYFLISNKESGSLLSARDETTAELTNNIQSNCYWFWSGDVIRSMKYPSRVLTISSKRGRPSSIPERGVSLQKRSIGLKQSWGYEDNKLRSTIDNKHDLELAIGGDNKLVVTVPELAKLQHWSLSLDPIYFVIANRKNGKVIATDKDANVQMFGYNGQDSQLWYWDDNNIRSKSFPDKVLKVDETGKVDLGTYIYSDPSQKWTINGNDNIKQLSNNSSILLCESDTDSIRGCREKISDGSKWTLELSRVHFFILHKKSGKVLSAKSKDALNLQKYNMSDNQLWFWDNEAIRNKEYPEKVLTMQKKGSHKIELKKFKGVENQNWEYENDFLKSKFNDLKIDATMFGKPNSNDKWGMTIAHDVFTIWNKNQGTLLGLTKEGEVNTQPYSGSDSQLWFWDGRSIRSKEYPSKVLDVKLTNKKDKIGAEVYLNDYNGSPSQNWRHLDDQFISDSEGKKLITGTDKSEIPKVVACKNCFPDTGSKWAFSAKDVSYFNLEDTKINGFLTFDGDSARKITTKKSDLDDSSLWFWEGNTIRSKRDHMYVLSLNKTKGNWWDVTANKYQEAPRPFIIQKFRPISSNFITAELQGFQIESDNKRTGGYAVPGRKSGNKRLKMVMPDDTTTPCLVKRGLLSATDTEWEPLASPMRDLFSSVGYSSKGREVELQGRAISLAYGDYKKPDSYDDYPSTERSYGDGPSSYNDYPSSKGGYSGPGSYGDYPSSDGGGGYGGGPDSYDDYPSSKYSHGRPSSYKDYPSSQRSHEDNDYPSSDDSYDKPGSFKDYPSSSPGHNNMLYPTLRKGIKFGIAPGVREKITVAKPSLNKGLQDALDEDYQSDQKSNKLTDVGEVRNFDHANQYAKSFSIDAPTFLKNINKLSNKLLVHKRVPLLESTQSRATNIKSLRMLKSKFIENKIKEGLCKRGKLKCVGRPTLPYSDTKSIFDDIKVNTPTGEQVESAKNRFLGYTQDMQDRFKLWKDNVRGKPTDDLITLDDMEKFAVYEYQNRPTINYYCRKIYDDMPLNDDILRSADKLGEATQQGILMQNYLKKNHITQPITTYRFEPLNNPKKFKVGKEFTENSFMSTSKIDKRTRLGPANQMGPAARPREITIHLKRSGSDLAGINPHMSHQEEVLVPIGTRFRTVKKENVEIEWQGKMVPVERVEIEEVV